MVSFEDAQLLIKLARESIDTYFSGHMLNQEPYEKFHAKKGVFVTLKKYGKLRGCIGYAEPVYALNRAIVQAARSAAFKDSRFPPMTEEEFEDITIEITVLTPPQELTQKHEEYPDYILIGRDGLIVEKGMFKGLLLPQVFVEYEATPIHALEMTCQKAGLHGDAWKNDDTKVFTFHGKVFEEEEPQGNIKEKKII